MDKMYPHMVVELLAQHKMLSIRFESNTLRVYLGGNETGAWYALNRDRSGIRRAVFCFETRDEVEDALLRTLWTWIRLMFPRTSSVMLRAQDARERLHRLEVEALLESEGVATVEIYPRKGLCPIERIGLDKLSLVSGIGLFGANIGDGSVRRISQCRLRALTLGTRRPEGRSWTSFCRGR